VDHDGRLENPTADSGFTACYSLHLATKLRGRDHATVTGPKLLRSNAASWAKLVTRRIS
jgi:hypothetical protein